MEQNLNDYANTYKEGFWIASGIFFVLFLIRLVLVMRNRSTRKWIGAAKQQAFLIVLKVLFFFGLLAFLADIPVWFITVATYRPIVDAWPQNVFLFILISICIQELILCFTISQSLLTQFIKRILFVLVSIFCSTAFILAAFIVPGTYQYPPADQSVLISLPVKGTWLAMHAGQNKWVNYHSNYPPQAYAIDMVKLNVDGKFFQNKGTDSTDFFSFGDSIFSPASGMVIDLADGFSTQPVYKGEDTLNPAGNFIELALDSQTFLFLGHLKKGSLQVKAGDKVLPGQFLALAGNSGNTSFPHLHLHIQNKPKFNDSLAFGQPFRFITLERKRFFDFHRVENAYLNRNDHFRN